MTIRVSRRVITAALLGLVAAAALGPTAPSGAQDRLVLKAADVHPLGYPTVEAVVRMGRKLEEATDGRLSIEMFHTMQLGGEKEMIEQAQVGALEFARISVGPVGTIVDELNVFNMPFVFRDVEHMRKVIDGPIGDELLELISTNPQTRLIGLAWMDAGARSIYNKVRPIHSLDDLTGLKIRMMGNPIFVDTMNALGGNGIAMGMDQVYNALQTGVVDMMDLTKSAYVGFRLHEVVPYLVETGHIWALGILFLAEDFFQSLTPEQQEAFLEIGAEAASYFNAEMAQDHAASMERAESEGASVVAVDRAAWQAAIEP
jgi:tripartite ATP-independent transporter DctP family solute receptor